jgi:hypothetical protein
VGDVERIQAVRDKAWSTRKRGTEQHGSRRASRAPAGVAGEAVGPPWRGDEARARAGESSAGAASPRAGQDGEGRGRGGCAVLGWLSRPSARGREGGSSRGSWAGSGANGPGQQAKWSQAEDGADRAGGVAKQAGAG